MRKLRENTYSYETILQKNLVIFDLANLVLRGLNSYIVVVVVVVVVVVLVGAC